jgi:myo-inositol catabolism protein IolC
VADDPLHGGWTNAALFPVLLGFMLGYAVLAHCAKVWFVRRWGM